MITTQEQAGRAIIHATYRQAHKTITDLEQTMLSILTMSKENNRKQKLGGKGRGMEGKAGTNIFILQSREPKDIIYG